MLARRLPSILPPMTLSEALETTKIHSVAGMLEPGASLLARRPFRSPHHTISGPGLIGGTLTGAFALAWLSGRFRWHSFTGPAETGRYLAGAGLMGRRRRDGRAVREARGAETLESYREFVDDWEAFQEAL